MPLTVADEELLAECRRRYYMQEKEVRKVLPDGTVTVHKTMDVEPIMNVMKEYNDIVGVNKFSKSRSTKLIGSIDPITAEIWAKETGLRIGSKEFTAFVSKRLRNDITYRKFRAGW